MKMEQLLAGYKLIWKNSQYRSVFTILTIVSMFSAMSIPIFPLWIEEVAQLPRSYVFFTLALSGLATPILNVIAGYWTDRVGNRKVLLELALLLMVLQGIMYTLFPYAWSVIAITWLTQFAKSSLLFAMIEDQIIREGHEDKRGILTSTVRSGVSFGYIVGPFFGILLANVVTYKYFFLVYGVLHAFLFIGSRFYLKKESRKRCNSHKRKARIEFKKQFFIISFSVLMAVCLLSGNMSVSSLLSLSVNDFASPWVLAIIFGLPPIIEIFVFPIVGLINDKLGSYKTLLIGIVCEVIYFVMLFFLKNPTWIIFIQLFGTVYTVVLFSSLMIFIQTKLPGQTGLSSALYFSSMNSSRVLGQFILGFTVMRWGTYAGFLSLGLLALIGLVICIGLEMNFTSKKIDRTALM
ncbi:SET family sugar efflux transporter-like MFS transporter [Paenibacillus sp. DS2363]|uniref:MFS transporter n=1 Tax=Paenibacillus TaxID=44249 RepID=UPI00209D8163|nr:MFS transporter [Paenibacillus xylanexedens]MCP1427469.1 putative MFS family arabinose efflux permease [Paenibacillus xylanexedens]